MKKTINKALQNTLGIIGLRKTKWILWALNALILTIIYNTSELSFLSFMGVTFLIIFTKLLQHISSLSEGMYAILHRNRWFKENVTEQTLKKRKTVESNKAEA